MTKQLMVNKTFLLTLLLILVLPLTTLMTYADNTALDDVVILETKGDYDEEEAARMKARIGGIHIAYLNVLAEQNIVIKLINFPLTDLKEYAYLKGKVPRGWEDTGYTWDDVPGAGGDPTVAKIGYSEPLTANFHDSLNLELHEIAHAVDQFVFDDISYKEEFMTIHATEQKAFLPGAYFKYVEEYFAEVFAYYYLNDETQAELRERAPKAYQFMEELPKKIPDTDPPRIILNGNEKVELDLDDLYNEEGAIALDDVYGDLSDKIKIDGEVDSSSSGEYEITYQVENEAGESATASRMVKVVRTRISDYIMYKKETINFKIQPIGKLKKQ